MRQACCGGERTFSLEFEAKVTEIRDLTAPEQWRHCPGKENPADDASRGLEMSKFLKNERWLKGPAFLWKTEDHWPEIKHDMFPLDKEGKRKCISPTLNRLQH